MCGPDVEGAFGTVARSSGYSLLVGSLTPGSYDIAVFPRSAVTKTFVPAKIVRVTIERQR